MATPDNASRRLRFVGNQQTPDDGTPTPDGGLTARQAAAFAALVADANQSAIQRTLDAMSSEQLRTLAVALATQVNAIENATAWWPTSDPTESARSRSRRRHRPSAQPATPSSAPTVTEQ